MTIKDRQRLDPPMTEEEIEMARVAQRCIVEALDRSRATSIMLTSEPGVPPVELPPRALRFFAEVLGAMSERRTIVLMPNKRELSTLEAAHFLKCVAPVRH
jgi:hypothetical protein